MPIRLIRFAVLPALLAMAACGSQQSEEAASAEPASAKTEATAAAPEPAAADTPADTAPAEPAEAADAQTPTKPADAGGKGLAALPADPEEREAALVREYGYLWKGVPFETMVVNGAFEQEWPDGVPLPPGWKKLADLPTPSFLCARMKKLHGLTAARMIGSTSNDTTIRAMLPCKAEDLRGKEVMFGVWVYSETPEQVGVRIIDNWKHYYERHPKKAKEWELVVVAAKITEDTTSVVLTVDLAQGNPAPECVIDSADFFLM